jgi:hypothetical protein
MHAEIPTTIKATPHIAVTEYFGDFDLKTRYSSNLSMTNISEIMYAMNRIENPLAIEYRLHIMFQWHM